jgi:hypothetical protein
VPSTIQAFRALQALDRLELVVLPIPLGAGVPALPAGRRAGVTRVAARLRAAARDERTLR